MDAPHDIYNYKVLDRNGDEVGEVTGFWVDDKTNRPEFASIKTGFIVGKNHLIPIRDAFFDHAKKTLRVPYAEERIKDAPTFAPDHDLTPQEEERVYAHYRLGREAGPVMAERAERPTAGVREGRVADRERVDVPLREERVDVGKREVASDAVRLRKVVKSEVQEVPVELKRERIDIERIPANELRGTYTGRAFDEDEVVMTATREEPVVDKHTDVVGGVRATKDVTTEREDVRANVRREDVEVDRDVDREGVRRG